MLVSGTSTNPFMKGKKMADTKKTDLRIISFLFVMVNCFRGDGVEDKTSEYISTYVGKWANNRGGGRPHICLAYEPPAASQSGKDGVRHSLSLIIKNI